MLGNHEDALDLAQESFIKVYQNLNRFKFNSSFSTWLFKITSNLCRDKLRKKQHILTTYSMSEDKINKKAMENIEKADNPENISISRQLSISIQEKIDQLSPKHKTVFVLREFEGLSYEEIAAVLEISVGTVKSRLSRARRSLREDLNKIIKDGGSK
jgi:RNA polymerase sigma-70 factor, ECF subfamily